MIAPSKTVQKIAINKAETVDLSAEEINEIRRKFEFDYSKYYFGSPLRWTNIIVLLILHVVTIHGFLTYDFFKTRQHLYIVFWGYFVGVVGGIGVTAGAHRLWCHRGYKAKLPLRIILIILFCTAGQNTLYEWVRDHRIHHKYSETDADPHNSHRGFFFSHIGWLMVKKHPEVIIKGRQLNLKDLTDDPVVRFQQKYFVYMKLFFCFILPSLIPIYFLREVHWYWSMASIVFARYCLSLHSTFLVNSVAHMWGTRPYDKKISPVENIFVALWSAGEGWHNYHHTFPWDYRASEFGKYNPTTSLLNFFAKMGWAYDLKAPSDELIRKVMDKQGDGSLKFNNNNKEMSE